MDLSRLVESALEKLKVERGITGLATAVFIDEEIIWKGGVGQSTYGYNADAKTLFSIQSITKPMTGLATLIAQSQGLLDLDKSLKYYLPDFRVNSAFEEHPEEKITLRMLRTHTAGFTHEAPVGGNFDLMFRSNADHLESIKDTWLKFPAGSDFSYSNLGYDLLAQVLENATSMTFNDYLRKVIFDPVGMASTTSDDVAFSTSSSKTEGVMPGLKVKHYPIPLIGSGSVYSNAEDMIKFIRMFVNHGNTDGRQVVSPDLLDRMMGFGLYVKPALGAYLAGSDGGGYGYGATIMWFPAYRIGCVLMGNSPGDYQTPAQKILEDCIRQLDLVSGTSALPPIPRIPVPYVPQPELRDRVMTATDPVFKPGWEKYCGRYVVDFRVTEAETTDEARPWYVDVARKGDGMWLGGVLGESQLRQYRPGLFFTKDGEALDLRQQPNTYRNIRIERVN